MTEDELLKVGKSGGKRNFMIKQKTINFSNLNNSKEVKNESVISDRKLRTI